MKIVFVLPVANLSGGIRVIKIYAEKLQARGHDVTLVSVQQAPLTVRERMQSWWHGHVPEWRQTPKRSHLDNTTVKHIRLPHSGPVTARDVPDADVVIATWWETIEWICDLPASKGVKVHFMQGFEIEGGPPAQVEAAIAQPMPRIVVAQWLSDLLVQQFHQTPPALVPNAVDTAIFHAPPRGKQPMPTVGFTYHTLPSKRTRDILEAYQQAREQLPDLRLISCGSMEPTAELPMPREAEFHLRATDRELPGLYARCDAWLFATRQEGFGLPILEAMACRTPVIATPAGAAPELLSGGGGELVPHENPVALAAAIVRCAALTDAAWRQISDRAWQTASSYTWDDAAAHFDEALQAAHQSRLARC